jgi:predicted Zn-dependent peptidase
MREVPVVDVTLAVRAGATADPDKAFGVAEMTAAMLDEGAGGRTALALEDELDYLGASLETDAGWDATTIRLHVPAARLAQALPILADVALRPDFPDAELKRLKKEALTELLQARDEPREIARAALARAVFGPTHRYGTPSGGDARSVAALTIQDLKAFHRLRYGADGAALIVAGDVDAATILPALETAFGTWAKSGGAPGRVSAPGPAKSRFVWLVDKPGAAQSVVRVGAPGPDRRTPDHARLQVMNTLLGGSFTSRLNDNLREQHGYAYGATSRFDYRRVGGVFLAAADVQTKSTAEALTEIVKELTRIRAPATDEEAERARNYTALGYAADFETTRQIGARLTERWVYGLPEDALTAFVPGALGVGVAEIQKAAQSHVDPARMAFVIVGDRKVVETPLRALKLGPLTVLSVEDVLGPAPRIE